MPILPLIPAAAILIVRRLEASERTFKLQRAKLVLPLLTSGALSLAVAWADADLANSARTATTLIHERAQAKGRRVWFQGHWGFQSYMEAAGGRPLDFGAQELGPGDLVVIPENNNNTLPLKPELVVSQEEIQVPAHPWLTTMQRKLGAGFYFYKSGDRSHSYSAPSRKNATKFFSLRRFLARSVALGSVGPVAHHLHHRHPRRSWPELSKDLVNPKIDPAQIKVTAIASFSSTGHVSSTPGKEIIKMLAYLCVIGLEL